MDECQIETNGVHLHVVQAGPSSGPLVILLHGFPEFWYGWRHQIPFLADAGFRVWAPDQRGYNLSDKPQEIAAYGLDELASDVIGLADAAGQQKVFVAGHDWGGAVAWWLAAKYPERLERMVVVNVPHGAVFAEHLRANPRQMLKSTYMLFFQLPGLPEALARLNDYKLLVRVLRASSRRGAFTDEDLKRYRQAWSEPGAYTSMLNWYRAAFRNPPAPPPTRRISVPTLLIWGAQDRFLGRELAQPSIDLCDEGRLVMLEQATHWVLHEEPERVNHLMATFFHDGETQRGPAKAGA